VNTFHLQISSAKSDLSDDFNGNHLLRGASSESVAATWPTSIFSQIRVLSARNFREARPRMLSKLNWLQTLALAIMAGLVWLKVNDHYDDAAMRFFIGTINLLCESSPPGSCNNISYLTDELGGDR